MPNKKGNKKKNSGSNIVVAATGFGTTKKNFPVLKKITDHKKSYVSPYSIKAIQKP
jgi:hypothetical protein